MCQVFGVSRSGYYNWVQHEPSDRKQSDERLKLEIKVAHIRTRETYGTRRLQTELAENGIIVGRDRLARLRKELRLRCKQKRKFRATTNSEQWRQQFPIEAMCQVFGVSRSGYYNWVQHEPSDRKQSDERLKLEIKVAHIRTRETYGTRRLQTELAENGIIVGRDRLARLRKELRLRCKQKRKFRATTNSNHNLPVAPNLLNQTFAPTAPNQVWVADLTYVATQEGWLYLAGIKDVYTCEIVGYAMGERMTKELTGKALFMALRSQRPPAGLIHHSDRGSQYCAYDYRVIQEQFGLKTSMSRKGNCYDNAPMESFWGTLKNESLSHYRFNNRDEAISVIREYIEIFYNRQRRHSRLGNISPAAFREKYHQMAA
ncbi:IS3 family transposase [Escherichia coli]|uniref:IS3 family transposase n=1 Tax=Escherichia coli TaxID=562 RepID=UPI00403DDBAD